MRFRAKKCRLDLFPLFMNEIRLVVNFYFLHALGVSPSSVFIIWILKLFEFKSCHWDNVIYAPSGGTLHLRSISQKLMRRGSVF